MCCLAYEHEYYERIQKTLPKIGKTVATPRGVGKVIRQNVLTATLTVVLDSEEEIEMSTDDIAGEDLFPKEIKKE
jgi:cell fate regulator YaaT (PSP1 superfamily)